MTIGRHEDWGAIAERDDQDGCMTQNVGPPPGAVICLDSGGRLSHRTRLHTPVLFLPPSP